MKPIFESCEPRPDVLSGELRDEMFAAMLEEVAVGEVDQWFGRCTEPDDGPRAQRTCRDLRSDR